MSPYGRTWPKAHNVNLSSSSPRVPDFYENEYTHSDQVTKAFRNYKNSGSNVTLIPRNPLCYQPSHVEPLGSKHWRFSSDQFSVCTQGSWTDLVTVSSVLEWFPLLSLNLWNGDCSCGDSINKIDLPPGKLWMENSEFLKVSRRT